MTPPGPSRPDPLRPDPSRPDPSRTSSSRPGPSLRALIVPVYLPSALLAFSEGVLVPVLPLFAADLVPSLATLGLVLAGYAIGLVLADLPAGALVGRLGERRAMIAGVLLVGGSTALLSAAVPIAAAVPGLGIGGTLVALRVLGGSGAALFGLSRHTFLAEITRRGGRGRAVAAAGGVNRIGALLGPAAGGAVGALFGLEAAMLLAGGSLVLTLPLLLRLPGRPRARPPAPAGALGGLTALRELLGARPGAVLAAAGGQLLGQGIRAGRRVLVPLWGDLALGLGVGPIGAVVTLAALVDASLFPLAGRLMDRLGRKWAMVPCFGVQALAMALLPLSGGLASFAAVAALMGFGNGLGAGTMMTLGADLAPPERTGSFLAAWRLLGDGGMMLVPLLVGWIAGALALPAAALAVATVGAGAAATFAWGVPETRPRGAPAD